MSLKVWVDQDLCTGDGLCEEIAPEVFVMHDDGLSYVKDRARSCFPAAHHQWLRFRTLSRECEGGGS